MSQSPATAPAQPAPRITSIPHVFRVSLPTGSSIEIAGDGDFVKSVYADVRNFAVRMLDERSATQVPPQIQAPVNGHPLALAAPAQAETPTRRAGKIPAKAKAKRRSKKSLLVCDQRPGQTFTMEQAAKAAGVSVAGVSLAMGQNRATGPSSLRFRRQEASAAVSNGEQAESDGQDERGFRSADNGAALVGAGAE